MRRFQGDVVDGRPLYQLPFDQRQGYDFGFHVAENDVPFFEQQKKRLDAMNAAIEKFSSSLPLGVDAQAELHHLRRSVESLWDRLHEIEAQRLLVPVSEGGCDVVDALHRDRSHAVSVVVGWMSHDRPRLESAQPSEGGPQNKYVDFHPPVEVVVEDFSGVVLSFLDRLFV